MVRPAAAARWKPVLNSAIVRSGAIAAVLSLAAGGCASDVQDTAEPAPIPEVGEAIDDGVDPAIRAIEDRNIPVSSIEIPELAAEDVFLVPGSENVGKDECNGLPSRNDVVSGAVYYFGYWGDWGCMQECPAGSYAYAISVKSEPPRGSSVDDTAANGVRLDCSMICCTF